MKIAIISDIHGNLEALNATLKDIKNRQVDKIICLGDIVTKGVHQKECLNLIRENCEIVLQGNCDKVSTLSQKDIEKLPDIEKNRIMWTQSLITKEDINYLSKLPFSYEFYMKCFYQVNIHYQTMLQML